MSVHVKQASVITSGTQAIGLGSLFATDAAAAPTYLVLSLLDRNEYTVGATRATGTITGAGHTLSLSACDGDGRGAGLVFAYQAASGRYYNSTYGYFDQLIYTASASLNDVTDLSVYGASSAPVQASDPGALLQSSATYYGTVTVANQPHATAPTGNATPDAVAKAAQSFVGQAWNENGCWVLASTIAAEAGASLPVVSTDIGPAGQANGAWIVAFNGPAGQSGAWQSLVHTGEIVVFGNAGGGGHITTCVSGSGASAQVIDNITYVNGSGQIQNSAHDGSAADVTVAAPHAASQEFAGVSASSVVIYELDTPVVADGAGTVSAKAGSVDALSGWFSVTDPGMRSVTQVQAYNASGSGLLAAGGAGQRATTAASAVTASSLSALTFDAEAGSGTDTLEVRAYNGVYWGDWQSLTVNVGGGASPAPSPSPAPAPPAPVPPARAPKPAAPVLASQLATQTVTEGQAVSFALPKGSFTDPQGQALSYAAKLSTGQALPGWLKFNAASATFSGTAPITPQTLGIKVTATDSSGLSASEVFQVSVLPPPPPARPVLLQQTADQAFAGGRVSFALPAGTFGGTGLHYAAVEVAGPNVTSWLKFDGTTGVFSGTTPAGFSGAVRVQVLAIGTGGTATETFGLRFGAGTSAHGLWHAGAFALHG